MPRPRNIMPTREIKMSLPEDVALRLQLFLTSDLDGKVPFGAYQQFFVARINEFLATRTLDISEPLGAEPGTYSVRATTTTLQALATKLE